MPRSPFHITPSDIIRQVETDLYFMQKSYDESMRRGDIKSDTRKHKIECYKTLIKLLKLSKCGLQTNIFSDFKKVKQ